MSDKEIKKRNMDSLRVHYDKEIDAIIARAQEKTELLKQYSTAARIELDDNEPFSPGTIDDLRAYCINFCDLVTTLSELHLIENRKIWTPDAAKILVEVMIHKLEGAPI